MAIQLNQKLGKPSFEELERTYKGLTRKEYESGEVTGEWRPMSVGGSVALAKGATMVVVDHELLHGAADLVLTQAEIDQLLKDHGDWEAAAEAYEKWQPREAHTLFQKIYNFFRRLMHMLRPNTSEAIFERIRSGQVWMRRKWGRGLAGQAEFFSQERGGARRPPLPSNPRPTGLRSAENGGSLAKSLTFGILFGPLPSRPPQSNALQATKRR